MEGINATCHQAPWQDVPACAGLRWALPHPLQQASWASQAPSAASAARPLPASAEALLSGSGDILEAWRSRRRQAALALQPPPSPPPLSTAERYSRYLAARQQRGAPHEPMPAAARCQLTHEAAGTSRPACEPRSSSSPPLQPERRQPAVGGAPLQAQAAAAGGDDILERWRARRRQLAQARGAASVGPPPLAGVERDAAAAGSPALSVGRAGAVEEAAGSYQHGPDCAEACASRPTLVLRDADAPMAPAVPSAGPGAGAAADVCSPSGAAQALEQAQEEKGCGSGVELLREPLSAPSSGRATPQPWGLRDR